MFIQFIVSMIATLSFAVLFCAPKSELLFCGLTGAIGWIVYLICLQFDTGTVIANMIATLALTVFSRVVAALRKNPDCAAIHESGKSKNLRFLVGFGAKPRRNPAIRNGNNQSCRSDRTRYHLRIFPAAGMV